MEQKPSEWSPKYMSEIPKFGGAFGANGYDRLGVLRSVGHEACAGDRSDADVEDRNPPTLKL